MIPKEAKGSNQIVRINKVTNSEECKHWQWFSDVTQSAHIPACVAT